VRAEETRNHEVSSMSAFFFHFLRDEIGATAIEYGLIAAGVALAIITTVQTLGSSINTTLYGRILAALQ
jgi:pilus assembly protein Flp/PilA